MVYGYSKSICLTMVYGYVSQWFTVMPSGQSFRVVIFLRRDCNAGVFL